MAGKARVHELAKEFGTDSKTVLAKLKDLGEFVKSASSTVEAPVVRKLRFHDLRHTTATLLLKAKVPLAIVQRILRHTDPKVTSEVYGHLDLDDLREGLKALDFGPLAERAPAPVVPLHPNLCCQFAANRLQPKR